MTPLIYTFGYEGLQIEAFIGRLQANGVETLVDVRELPLSRKKGFSKNTLREHLALAGIRYEHMPQLGCPKPIRDAYRQDADWQRYTRAFNAYLRLQVEPINALAQLAKKEVSCLMCFEADHQTCHRTYVARSLQRIISFEIVHLQAKTTQAEAPLRRAA